MKSIASFFLTVLLSRLFLGYCSSFHSGRQNPNAPWNDNDSCYLRCVAACARSIKHDLKHCKSACKPLQNTICEEETCWEKCTENMGPTVECSLPSLNYTSYENPIGSGNFSITITADQNTNGRLESENLPCYKLWIGQPLSGGPLEASASHSTQLVTETYCPKSRIFNETISDVLHTGNFYLMHLCAVISPSYKVNWDSVFMMNFID